MPTIISFHLTGFRFCCLIGRMDKAENEIIKLVLNGDRDAYRALVDRHYQFAFRIACRITGDPDDAEEVAQEAFLRAYTQLSTFRQDSSFSTWVNRIAMNQALNLVERRKRDLLRSSEQIADVPNSEGAMQLADGKAGPERQLLDREFKSLREAAMATLTPMERTAFSLRHMEDMPISEIAEALHVPANSAKQAVFRAVSKLRRTLVPAMGGIVEPHF
jgi:RNA polymerase sigma-70 factor (ECF subfamily)